jgi:acyl dehydratase
MPYSYEPHYFDDLEVGQTFESAGRTITESEFALHSMLTGDWTELHTNREYAADGPYGQRIAHGPMTFIIATGLFQRTGVVERTVIAFLGMNYMDVPNPVYVDDTISAAYEITEKRELDSRDDAGFVCVDSVVEKQDDTTVFEGDMKFLWKYESAE